MSLYAGKRSPSWFLSGSKLIALINEVNFPEGRYKVSGEYCVLTLVFLHNYHRGNYSAETNNRISVKIHMCVC